MQAIQSRLIECPIPGRYVLTCNNPSSRLKNGEQIKRVGQKIDSAA